jgi:hypothetical protein
MGGDEPVSFNRKSADLIGRTIKEFRGRGRGELPPPKRRRMPDGGGAARATIAGSTYMATLPIDAAREITWADVPGDVKSSIPASDTINGADKCWILGKGPATPYQLAAAVNEDGVITDIYMVPVAGGDDKLIYNSAGDVSENQPLQVKQFTLTVGGSTTHISLIDVEKC